MIPLSDVKIVPIGVSEFTVSSVTRAANTHYFRAPNPAVVKDWYHVLGLAIQQEIVSTFQPPKARRPTFPFQRGSSKHTLERNKSNPNNTTTNIQKQEVTSQFYKPICWDIEELRRESGGGLTHTLQLEEVYSNDGDVTRRGWRILGGTFSDLVYWCLLTCDKSQQGSISISHSSSK